MFMAVKFDDGRPITVYRVKDEKEVLRKKRELESDYRLKQIGVMTRDKVIFKAAKIKPPIWKMGKLPVDRSNEDSGVGGTKLFGDGGQFSLNDKDKGNYIWEKMQKDLLEGVKDDDS